MAAHNANFEVVLLTGSTTFNNGTPATASTIHQIYCLSTGSIVITPMKGPAFTWAGTANASIDVMTKAVVVSSGTFIGFRSKVDKISYYNPG